MWMYGYFINKKFEALRSKITYLVSLHQPRSDFKTREGTRIFQTADFNVKIDLKISLVELTGFLKKI